MPQKNKNPKRGYKSIKFKIENRPHQPLIFALYTTSIAGNWITDPYAIGTIDNITRHIKSLTTRRLNQ